MSYINVITAQAIELATARNTVALLGARYVASVQLIQALGGGWSPDPAVAAVKTAAAEAAIRRIFIGAHHKFGTATFAKFAEVTDFELLITGHELAASMANHFSITGVPVLRV